MKNHYLPESFLKQFVGASGLWVFNIRDGSFRCRNPSNTGHIRGLYKDSLEEGYLQKIDGQAAGLLSEIGGARGLVPNLSTKEKRLLSDWIALFMIRVPKTLHSFEKLVAESKRDKSQAIDILNQNRDKTIAIARRTSPRAFADLVRDFGEASAEEIVLKMYEREIYQGNVAYSPTASRCFNDHIVDVRVEKYAKKLLSYSWSWLQAKSGFIIGDNPLCRWHAKSNKWDYGINNKGVEVSIPLNSHLCLLIRRKQTRSKQIISISQKQNVEMNTRQIMSSFNYVFGSEGLLRPIAKRCVEKALSTKELANPPRHMP